MPKPKPGRPKMLKGGFQRYNVSLDAASVRFLRRLGDENLSAGIREAVKRLRDAGFTAKPQSKD
ncbi:MAG: hypothetical protein QJR02_02020 [Sinobacteraceae bacterium]|nr:hypothetical protein [Nevskiaceae bacterium]